MVSVVKVPLSSTSASRIFISSSQAKTVQLVLSQFQLTPVYLNKMSLCKSFGKDKVVFVTKEDHEKPCSIQLPEEEEPRGLIMPNGDINWNCPCIGATASGPCGYEFREAFTCFHYSTSETKGTECLEKFQILNQCMSEYPGLFKKSEQEEEDSNREELEAFDKEKVSEELKQLEQRKIAKDEEKKSVPN